MPIIKKSVFENKCNLDELIDSDGAIIGGDRNVNNNSEIETGPVQKSFNDDSEYEKGVSTTTDRAARYRQNIPWFANYSYSGPRGIQTVQETNSKIIKKKHVEEKVDDLVKRQKDRGISTKDSEDVEKQLKSLIGKEFDPEILSNLKDMIEDKLDTIKFIKEI